MPIETIERHLNWPVMATVPSDPLAIALSLSQGQPLVARDHNHAVSKAIVKLARQLAGGPSEEAAKSEAGALMPSVEKRMGAQVTRFTLSTKPAWGT